MIVPNNFGVKKRKARTIPFGYKVSPDNPDYLVPVPNELEAIKKAKEYIAKNYTWRAVHEWLMKATGRKVSLAGFYKIIKKRKDV